MQCNPLVTVQKTVITEPSQNHKLSQVFTKLLQHSSATEGIVLLIHYNNLQSTWIRCLLGNSTTVQKIPFLLWKLQIHFYVHKNHHRTLFWASKIHSTIQHHISLTFIIILSYYLHLCLHVICFLQLFPLWFWVYISSPLCGLHVFAYLIFPDPDGWLCSDVVNFNYPSKPLRLYKRQAECMHKEK